MREDISLADDTIIWRYMNLESFISLISNQKLSFCRLDKLRSMDPYEGSNSRLELEQQDFIFKILDKVYKMNGNVLLKDTGFAREVYRNCLEDLNKQYFINCWHINDFESVAMWDSFTKSKTGIAIKTNLGSLKKSLKDDYDFNYEKVEYVNLDTYTGSVNSLLRKTKYFEHEKELRVYFTFVKERIEEKYEVEVDCNKICGVTNKINNPDRMEISVDISQLISDIIVSPKSEEWFMNLISKLLDDYNIRITPKQSDIKAQNIKVRSGEYSLINVEDELKNFIENSSEGQAARAAIYRFNYDEKSGEIKGCYPTDFSYKEIPEPYINASWEEWKKWCSNQSSVRVDIKSKRIIFDD